MLKIVTVPNDLLTIPSKPVDSFNDKLHELINDMEKVLNAQVDPQGVGLAAPQVGIGLSIFIMKPTPKSSVTAYVNPKILKSQNPKFPTPSASGGLRGINNIKNKKQRRKYHFEGCLSIPKIWSPVNRAKKLLIEYQTVDGEKKTEWFTGFKAVIIQHEVDHLKGILFTQRALEQKSQLYEEKKGKLVKLEY